MFSLFTPLEITNSSKSSVKLCFCLKKLIRRLIGRNMRFNTADSVVKLHRVCVASARFKSRCL